MWHKSGRGDVAVLGRRGSYRRDARSERNARQIDAHKQPPFPLRGLCCHFSSLPESVQPSQLSPDGRIDRTTSKHQGIAQYHLCPRERKDEDQTPFRESQWSHVTLYETGTSGGDASSDTDMIADKGIG